jgi:hypothetical protein
MSQPVVPMNTGPCPPTPGEVPQAVDAALESRSALRAAQDQWNQCETDSVSYRRIVGEYEHRLADSLGDRVRLREEMRGFGAYLRRSDVKAAHIVLCVHEAMRDVAAAPDLFDTGGLGQEMIQWAIDGYYGNGDTTDSPL